MCNNYTKERSRISYRSHIYLVDIYIYRSVIHVTSIACLSHVNFLNDNNVIYYFNQALYSMGAGLHSNGRLSLKGSWGDLKE